MKTPEITLPPDVEARFGESADKVALELANTVAECLSARLLSAQRASLAVSGGSTPVPFFHALSRKELDWGRVDIVLVDERWVDEADQASNTRLVKENLLQNNAAAAHYFSLKQEGAAPEEGLNAARAELANLSRPLDVLILGMGNDGHTASLFPDAPEIAMAMDLNNQQGVAAIAPPSQDHPRITLTYPLMLKSRFVALHLKGNDKLDTLKRALSQPNDLLAMPIRGFLKRSLQIFWSA